MARTYAYAIQVAGCATIYGTHTTGPSLTYTLSASIPAYGYVQAMEVTEATQAVFDRSLAGEASGVVTIDDITVSLRSARIHGRDTATDAGRVFGRYGFDGMEWYAALQESVTRDTALPVFDIEDKGQAVPAIVYVGREAMEVTSSGSNPIEITAARRAVLGTPRHDHRLDVDRGDVPYMTPHPLSWRGARVNLWRAERRADGSLGTWVVRFRGDIAEDPSDHVSHIVLRIQPITARLTQPLATRQRTLRLSDLHTWSDGIGTSVAVYAWAERRDLFDVNVAVQANIGDADIELAALADGSAGTTAHSAVADITNLPQGHPRTVPVCQRPTYEYDVTGYTPPNIDISPNVYLRDIYVTDQPIDTLYNVPIGESVLLELVDTSGGAVTADGPAYLRNQFADTTAFGIGDRDFAIAGATRLTATWARVVRTVGDAGPVWRMTSKVDPARRYSIGLSNTYGAGDLLDEIRTSGIPGIIRSNCWVSGAQQTLEDAAGGRPEDYPSPFLSSLVWSWSTPEIAESLRAVSNGDRYAESGLIVSRGGAQRPGQVVSLSRVGESVDVPAAPFARRWYQAGERYITLDGATGVGGAGRLVLEVRREGDDEVIGKCVAVAETQLANGDYRVELEVPAGREDDYALPTIVEGVPGATTRFTFTPAFIAENVTGGLGEVAMQLITSGGGDGINATYDVAPFGGELLDGSGSLGDSDMGADVDAVSILSLPTIAGAEISVIGRPSSDGGDGDSVVSLLSPHLETTGYVLDLVVDPDPSDPFDGCLLKARPVRRPSPFEIRGTIDGRRIADRVRVGVDPVNTFEFGANYGRDGKPQIVIRAAFGASIGLYGERQAQKRDLHGVTFPNENAALINLRPYLTRLIEKAIPPARYELTVETGHVRDLGISYGDAYYVTDPRAPLPDGTLGLSVAPARVVSMTLDELSPTSQVVVDLYPTVARGRAPCCAVIDYVDASTVKVAGNFFAALLDPTTGATITDMDLLLNPSYGDGLGVGTKITIRQRGDVDTTRRMQVAAYDVVAGTIEVEDDPAEAVYGDAHGIPDPGAEQAPEDYVATIEPRETATAPAGHTSYFYHGRDIIA